MKINISHKSLCEQVTYSPETGIFTRLSGYKKGKAAGTISKSTGYVQFALAGKTYLAHRLAWFYVHGYWPKAVDHVNRNKQDNRLSNLREVTYSQNMHNLPVSKRNSSGYLGVSKAPRTEKWVAYVCVNYKNKFLGSFDTPEKASAAYVAAKDSITNKVSA
jgi:hypothetical protein